MPAPSFQDEAEAQEEQRRIARLLDKLQPRQAEIIRLHIHAGLKFTEIAEMLDEPATTIKSRFTSGIEKLKQMYDHQMYFTANLSMEPDASEEEVDAVVEKFIKGIGADNRVLVEAMGPPSLKEKLYIATRKNFDRLVEEGKAIL